MKQQRTYQSSNGLVIILAQDTNQANIGTRHQLGGEPTYIQAKIHPVCPDCKEKMTFYAQLDSINDEFCIADCGMIYVFVCLECNTVEAFIESF